MIDLEDIFKAIISHMMEMVQPEEGDPMSRLNFFITNKNIEKGDTLLELIPNDEGRFVLNQRMKDMKAFKNWIDIAVAEVVDFDSNFEATAKNYIISVNSILMDDLSNNTFYRSVRMADVLKDIMIDFLRNKMQYGFVNGQPESNTLPERVLVEGAKAIKSGVLYMVTIH